MRTSGAGKIDVDKTETRLEIYMDNRRALVDYAAPIVGSQSSAEDVVQEAYFRFVPPPGPPSSVRSPVSYLFRIVRNIAIDVTRRSTAEARRDAHFADAIDRSPRVPSPEDELQSRETLTLVEDALSELPADARAAFLMKRMEGASYQTIAERLRVSKAGAHRKVQRALTHLMIRMQEKDD